MELCFIDICLRIAAPNGVGSTSPYSAGEIPLRVLTTVTVQIILRFEAYNSVLNKIIRYFCPIPAVWQ
ncbi:MAG: hypothetical protein U0Y96_03180 [Candidatus Kapaibacterium sp.]